MTATVSQVLGSVHAVPLHRHGEVVGALDLFDAHRVPDLARRGTLS